MSTIKSITGFFVRVLNPRQYKQTKNSLGSVGKSIPTLKAIREICEKKEQPSVLNDFEKDEFELRYRNARISAFIVLSFSIYSAARLLLANEMMEAILSLLAFTFCFVFYMDIVRRLHAGRKLWKEWGDRKKGVFVTWIEFANAFSESPSIVLPLKLKKQ